MAELTKDIQYVKGVGPSKAKLFNNLGINTIKDLITYYPREHEDRSIPTPIIELIDQEEALIEAKAMTPINELKTGRGLSIYRLLVSDESGSCQIAWYNQSYLKGKFKVGQTYRFFGKVNCKFGKTEMQSPVFDEEGKSINTGKIMPIYPATYGLTQNTIRKVMEQVLLDSLPHIEETLPDYLIKEYQLCDIKTATKQIHFPDNFKSLKTARKRLAFEELLFMQLALLNLKNQYTKEEGIMFDKNVKMSDVINKLPFKLTNAQLRVLEEIDNDMESNKTMNRLVQGDVGAGKTIVSIIATYKAVKSGYQAAIMAPTAILATQHFVNFNSILSQFGISCELLVSGITKSKKDKILQRLENGEIDILIGTHAILEDKVKFKNLGFVVTDEQHRFGVKQRGIITEKGNNVDVIVMTATPIPRTLALILFGDLDISIIDELPPNRKEIDTFAVTKGLEARVNAFIAKQIEDGRQAYIVCPLVEENEEINAQSVMELVEKYKNTVFPNYKVEYLHGKMRPKEKSEIMELFKKGKIDVLISTTVIEVGVDVPNATIMVIENAERFGLAQLHQLRGRVGRGEHKSYCILKYQGKSDLIRQRMKVMTETNNGFTISEKDLELRGTGEFFGTRQHGLPDFKVANLFEDMNLLKQVQALAIKIMQQDPKLEMTQNEVLGHALSQKYLEGIKL